jgi:SAM-dependent methyltransferase
MTEEKTQEFQRCVEVPRAATLGFVTANLNPPADILEVGCGVGHLVVALNELGFRVTGLEADLDIVARAQADGAPVQYASWPEHDCEAVDAVLFTRSLHHIGDLAAAVAGVGPALRPGGELLVEDFAVDRVDEETLGWFAETCRSEAGLVLIDPAADETLKALLATHTPAVAWSESHDHDLHPFDAMQAAIAEFFEISVMEEVPYLYRYLALALPDEEEALDFLCAVRDEEARLGSEGKIRLIGRNLVAARA